MSDFLRALLTAPRGNFLMLEPGKDALLVFAQEETAPVLLDDDFSSYKGVFWMPIARFEANEAWNAEIGSVEELSGIVEGSGSTRATCADGLYGGFAILLAQPVWDISGGGIFTNDDFIVFCGYHSLLDFIQLYFYRGITAGYAYFELEDVTPPVTPPFFTRKRSAFDQGLVRNDYDDIRFTGMNAGESTGNVILDYLRQEKADPANAAIPNATGGTWNFQPNAGRWTITEDVIGASAMLACLDIGVGEEKSALADLTTPDDVQFTARVYAKREAGLVGLIFRSGQDTLTEGEEDCYAVLLDTDSNLLLVRKYANGTPTEITAGGAGIAFTSAPDTWYAMGVTASGTTIKVYAKVVDNFSQDDDVLDEANLLDTITDGTYTGGQCGLMSISTLGRFGRVRMFDAASDKVRPGCALTLLGKAIFRTIAPFCE